MASPVAEPRSGGTLPMSTESSNVIRNGASNLYALIADLPRRVSGAFPADPEVVEFAARVSVWGRWCLWVGGLIELAYRPEFWLTTEREHLLTHVPLVVLNAITHYRLHTRRQVTWRWLLFLSAVDIALITGAVIVGFEFHSMEFVLYYPAVALFSVVFTSLWLSLGWTTMVAVIYTAVILAGPGLDLEAGQEKALFARVGAMFGVAGVVSLIARFERVRRRESVRRELELQRERIELSQAIHDTAAQTAHMIYMGVRRAMRLSDGANEELNTALAATATLSKTAMWELRRPIDEGPLFEGRDLGGVLWSHTETFAQISSVLAEMRQTGKEPPMPVETRAGLFSIAHNALANAFRHAQASRVEVRLDFDDGAVRLSIWDNGVGLPADYATRGRGFRGMTADAERLGGRLLVETGGPGGGTTITCEAPL